MPVTTRSGDASAAASEKSSQTVLSATTASRGIGPTALKLAASVAVLAVLIVAATHVPSMPYRIRELPNRYHPLLAPILLATFVVWVFGFPAVLARWLTFANSRGAAFPLVVAVYGVIGCALIHNAVLPASIQTLIGSPVLSWPWQAEFMARFVALLSTLVVPLSGGALLAAAVTGGRVGTGPIWWFLSAAILFPVQYWVIVTKAATDNLTELIAENAGIGAFLLLVLYLLLVGFTGSLLASLRAESGRVRVSFALVTVFASLPIGYFLLAAGTESLLIKDQKAYSALQSLLSMDRAHYAVGYSLWARLLTAHLGLIFMTTFAQFPLWGGWQKRYPRPRHAHSK